VRQTKLAPPSARFGRRKYIEFQGHPTILPADPCIALQLDDTSELVS
jgi:hypothetical protein